MGLEIQTHYTKDGKQYELNTPRMDVGGKHMDDGEEHRFYALADPQVAEPGTKYNPGKYPRRTLFAKFDDPNQDQAFTMQLSSQAYNSIMKEGVVKGSVFTIKKQWWDNPKNGAKTPIVDVKVVGGEIGDVSRPQESLLNSSDIESFVTEYLTDCELAKQNKEHCVASYWASKQPKATLAVAEVYEALKNTTSAK